MTVPVDRSRTRISLMPHILVAEVCNFCGTCSNIKRFLSPTDPMFSEPPLRFTPISVQALPKNPCGAGLDRTPTPTPTEPTSETANKIGSEKIIAKQ